MHTPFLLRLFESVAGPIDLGWIGRFGKWLTVTGGVDAQNHTPLALQADEEFYPPR